MEPVEPQTAPLDTEERETDRPPEQTPVEEVISAEMLVEDEQQEDGEYDQSPLKALIEAVIYITDEPLSAQQIAAALEQPIESVVGILEELTREYQHPSRGLSLRELAGGYKMSTKPEHHEAIRQFVKNLKPALKLSLAALETLAVIAYKQPITAPEIMEIRGVQGAGVLKTLIERKLVAPAGRKAVVGKPILYKTTKDFLIQFGLKDLAELPTLKEFEELNRFALGESEGEARQETAADASEATERNELWSDAESGQEGQYAAAAQETAAGPDVNPAADPVAETGYEAPSDAAAAPNGEKAVPAAESETAAGENNETPPESAETI